MNTRAKEQLDIMISNILMILDCYNKMNPEFPLTIDQLIEHLNNKIKN